MAAISDLSDLINRATGGASGTPEVITFFTDGRVGLAAAATPPAGRWVSLWNYNGAPGTSTAFPGATAVPNNTTVGGLRQATPGGGRQKWLLGMSATCLTGGILMLYDRLLHVSGLNGTLLTPQTVQGGTAGARTPPLTRYTNGLGNQAWIEIYTSIGVTGTYLTMSYDDQAGALSSTTAAPTPIGATNLREAQRILPIPLAAGDSGVSGIASVTLLGTTATAGDFGITVAHPLAYLHIPVGGMLGVVSWVGGDIPEIKPDACLALAWMPITAAPPQVFGQIFSVEA